jgi:Large eukaryotic DNA virus major capsid protein/Major capsid protein N-terminus
VGQIDLATYDQSICKIWERKDWSSVGQIETKGNGRSFVYNLNTRYIKDVIRGASLCFKLPKVVLKNPGNFKRLRWTRNLAHNLVNSILLTIDDNEMWKFTSISLDYITAFRKDDDYYRLIGNIPELINPTQINHEEGIILPSRTVYLPLDFQSNQEVFVPVSNKPIKLYVSFNEIENVLILDDFLNNISRPVCKTDIVNDVSLDVSLIKDLHMFTSHIPRHILPDNWVFNSTVTMRATHETGFDNISTRTHDLVHCMYFGVKNTSNSAEHSNYSTVEPYLQLKCINNEYVPAGVNFEGMGRDSPRDWVKSYLFNLSIQPDLAGTILSYYYCDEHPNINPIEKIRVIYNTSSLRVGGEASFFSQLHPYKVGGKMPTFPGYHMYCFGPNLNKIDCAVNFGALDSVHVKYKLNPVVDSSQFEPFVILHTYQFEYHDKFVFRSLTYDPPTPYNPGLF